MDRVTHLSTSGYDDASREKHRFVRHPRALLNHERGSLSRPVASAAADPVQERALDRGARSCCRQTPPEW